MPSIVNSTPMKGCHDRHLLSKDLISYRYSKAPVNASVTAGRLSLQSGCPESPGIKLQNEKHFISHYYIKSFFIAIPLKKEKRKKKGGGGNNTQIIALLTSLLQEWDQHTSCPAPKVLLPAPPHYGSLGWASMHPLYPPCIGISLSSLQTSGKGGTERGEE